MRTKVIGPLFLIAMLVGAPVLADPDHWANRLQVIRAAERLAAEIEHLDEALHDAKAEAHFIKKVHHTEETVKEFVVLVQGNGTYTQASAEFTHIRQDTLSIRNEFASHPQLLQYPNVGKEWRATWTAYRNLDHEMYMNDTVRWTPGAVDRLEKELETLDALHE